VFCRSEWMGVMKLCLEVPQLKVLRISPVGLQKCTSWKAHHPTCSKSSGRPWTLELCWDAPSMYEVFSTPKDVKGKKMQCLYYQLFVPTDHQCSRLWGHYSSEACERTCLLSYWGNWGYFFYLSVILLFFWASLIRLNSDISLCIGLVKEDIY